MIKKIIPAIFIFLFSVTALASSAAQNLQRSLGTMKTFQANFKQTTTSKVAEYLVTATGEVKIKRPGQFYWQVQNPGKQVIVINNGTLWLYDVDLQQLTIKKISEQTIALNPATLLSGDLTKLLSKSSVTQSVASGGLVAYTLRPHEPNGSFKWIRISFKNGTLKSLSFANQLQQTTTIQFSNTKINQPVSANYFHIHVSKNTDIVKN